MLSGDRERLFVDGSGTGLMHVFEVASKSKIGTIDTGLESISRIDMALSSKVLHSVDNITNILFTVLKE